jgi:hypothetical protein
VGTIDRKIAIRDARATRDGNSRGGRTRIRVVSLRLDNGQYRRLKRYISDYQDETGERVTYQAILEIALAEYLALNEPSLA